MAVAFEITGTTTFPLGAAFPFVIGAFDFSTEPEPPHPDGTPAADYCELAIDRLLEQFKGRPRIRGLICALADRATNIEQALINVKEFRSLDTALGAQLDALGDFYREPRSGEDDDSYRARLKALALVVASKGRPNEMLDILVQLDDGFAPSTIALISHFPACFIMTVDVPLGGQLIGERFGRILKRAVPAGVCFQLHFKEQGATYHVWEGDPGEGFAEASDPSGTGGIWVEAV